VDEYVYTSDDTVVEGAVDPGKLYEERDFNKIIEIKAREAYRVSLFMGMIDQREKTIVFCATQLHALAVRDLINQMKTSRDPNYCVRVTANDGARGDQYLREFRDNEKTIPTILTTSQKLSTSVDARNIRNIVLMRPINSMIEFKQIIGRGTRIYDGKDYFTIYDFVKAHHFFSDPEWDGEPEEVTSPKVGVAAGPSPEPTDHEPPEGVEPPPAKIVVRLADGNERTIQSMVQTTFWDPSGKPMSATEFLESLFGALPAFFKREEDLRAIWSVPDTRKALLAGLADKGFGTDALSEMQRVIDAENSDIFDVLAYVAFALQPLTRVRRAADARDRVRLRYTDKQQAFIDFVLAQYTKEGVGELDGDKLAPLLKLRYKNAIADATFDLGRPDEIRGLFIGFQRYLYEPSGAHSQGS
jgi:type I restriction enzyme R subunit